MFRRLSTPSVALLSVAGRFNATEVAKESAVEAPKVVAAPKAAKGPKPDPNETLKEFLVKAQDPLGLPKTKASVKPAGADDYIYHRGSNSYPTASDLRSRVNADIYRQGQILARKDIHMMPRDEVKAAQQAAIAVGHELPPFNNPTSTETSAVHYSCPAINPLEHDLVYHGGKNLRAGQVTKALRGGTYLRL